MEFDFEVFHGAGHLLYAGPWVAERLAAIHTFAREHASAIHPVTAQILLGAGSITAVSAFEAMYKVAELSRETEREWARMDLMLLPTAGNCYTHEQIEASPIARNTNLGYYTNFANLLDLAAVAIPAGKRRNGMPFGVSVLAPAWSDAALLGIADRLHRVYDDPDVPALEQPYCPEGYVPLAVCGAHLAGQLTESGAF